MSDCGDVAMLAGLTEECLTLNTALSSLLETEHFASAEDKGDAVLCITAGSGGAEARDFAKIILRMYLSWADGAGLRAERLEYTEDAMGGLRQGRYLIRGQGAYG